MRPRLAVACIGGICAATLTWFLANGSGEPVPASPPASPRSVTTAAANSDLSKTETVSPSIPPRDLPAREVVATPEPKQATSEQPPLEATVAVLVLDANTGRPLPGVRLTLRRKDRRQYGCLHVESSTGSPTECPRTDDDGRADFIVPLGIEYVVSSQAMSLSAGPAEQDVPEFSVPGRIDVLLEVPSGNDLTFVGRVVADETDGPVPGAHVSIRRAVTFVLNDEELEPKSEKDCVADANGYFEVQVSSWTSLYAKVEAPGRSQALVKVAKGHEDFAHAVKVRLSRAASLNVLVLDATNAPLENVRVSLTTSSFELDQTEGSDYLMVSDPSWSARTESNGRCAIEGLPSSVPLDLEYLLDGAVSRKEPKPLQLDAGELREIVFRLGAGASIAGWLFARDGSAVAGAEVWMIPSEEDPARYLESYEEDEARTAVSATDGRFEFADVADGDWLVGPSAEGPYAPLAELVHVVDGVADRELRLPAHSGLFIRGTVTDSAGKPVAEVFVDANGPNQGFGQTSEQSDEQGHFTIGPLIEEEYVVSATFVPNGYAPPEPIRVRAGTDDVEIRLPAGVVFRGVLIDASTGEPLRGEIMVTRTDSSRADEPPVGRGLYADQKGHFEVGGLPSGTYDFGAVADNGLVATARGVVAVPSVESPEIALRARPGAQVIVRCEGEGDSAFLTFSSDGVECGWDGVASGSETTRFVPAGSIRVKCHRLGIETPEVKELTLGVGEHGIVVFGEKK